METQKDIYEQEAIRISTEVARSLVMPIQADSLTPKDIEKIKNNAERYGLSYNEVLTSVLNDKVSYLNVVGKTTSRQGLPEKVFKNYIEERKIVSSIEKLPVGGQEALYLIDGEIRSRRDNLSDAEIARAGVKSLDFKIITKKGTIGYIIAKYTKIDGGSQDNQYQDVLGTLKHYKPNDNFLLIANVDGNYYYKHRNKSGKNYIDYMKETFNYPNLFITTYKTFQSEIEDK